MSGVQLVHGSPEARAVFQIMAGEPIVHVEPSAGMDEDQQVALIVGYLEGIREVQVTAMRVGFGACWRSARRVASYLRSCDLPADAFPVRPGQLQVVADSGMGLQGLVMSVVSPRRHAAFSSLGLLTARSGELRLLPPFGWSQVLVTGADPLTTEAPDWLREMAKGPEAPDFWPEMPFEVILAGAPE